ncbi:hypothetical protein ABPG72_000576 [Tetrahymena utriculariae]
MQILIFFQLNFFFYIYYYCCLFEENLVVFFEFNFSLFINTFSNKLNYFGRNEKAQEVVAKVYDVFYFVCIFQPFYDFCPQNLYYIYQIIFNQFIYNGYCWRLLKCESYTDVWEIQTLIIGVCAFKIEKFAQIFRYEYVQFKILEKLVVVTFLQMLENQLVLFWQGDRHFEFKRWDNCYCYPAFLSL